MADLVGAIEAGGTKFVCLIGTGPNDIIAQTRIPTTQPAETIARTIQFFKENSPRPLAAVGIGSFGPVDLDRLSPTYGSITSTPKPGWQNTDLRGEIQNGLDVPVAWETDVNTACFGEYRWGAAQGLSDFFYMTVGTGVGAGILVNGQLLHGLVHPETGHIRLPHDPQVDPFPGSCPFHGDCFEGLASGPAIERRWGVKGQNLPVNHPAWALEAHYIALALHNLICTFSPQRVIIGGGVLQQETLYPLIRRETLSLLNGYVQSPRILSDIDGYIVPPGLGGFSGSLGALALALKLHRERRSPYLDD